MYKYAFKLTKYPKKVKECFQKKKKPLKKAK